MQNLLLFLSLVFSIPTLAYQDSTYFVGLGPSSFGLFNKVTSQDSRKTDVLGNIEYLPLSAGSSWQIADWYLSPEIFTTWLYPTKIDSGTQKSFFAFFLPIGKNFNFSSSAPSKSSSSYKPHLYGKPSSSSSSSSRNLSNSIWDWNFAPGVYLQEIKGTGGTFTDQFGAVTYYPDGKSSSKIYTLSTGIGYESGHLRTSGELVFFDFFDSNKRSYNLFMNICWLGDW